MPPITGRFCRSRSPPQPSTTTSRPPAGTSARAVASSRSSASGRVREVDQGERPTGGRSRPAPSGRARPGSPPTPAAAVAGSTPASTSVTTASAALATLKSPASRVPQSRRSPSGPTSVKRAAPGPTSASSTRQSASAPDGETVVTGTVPSPTSRRPCASSTSTTPRRVRSGVNSVAFACEVLLQVGVEVEVVLAEVGEERRRRTSVPSTRPRASAWLETSIATASTPRSRITASSACRSGASGVVRSLLRTSSPIRVSMVPMTPVRRPARRSPASSRYAVVVFPLVPVTPTIVMALAGSP